MKAQKVEQVESFSEVEQANLELVPEELADPEEERIPDLGGVASEDIAKDSDEDSDEALDEDLDEDSDEDSDEVPRRPKRRPKRQPSQLPQQIWPQQIWQPMKSPRK